jgi:hypothetical protein
MALPQLTASADLPPGVYQATLGETVAHFAVRSPRRTIMGQRLERIYRLVAATGHLGRFIVFGSFVTSKSEPNDVDVFLLMADSFDVDQVTGEARFLFDHAVAQSYFGASVFWLRRLAAFGGEQQTIEYLQTKRDGSLRGIVEIISE